MSVIGRLLATSTIVTPFTPRTYDDAFPNAHLPANVTPDGAMAIPAVYACTTVISEDIAKVPLQMFQSTTDGKELAKSHPLYDLLHDQPNRHQTALEWREMMTAFALNRDIGGVSEIVPGPRGPVDQLVPLHPDLLQREVTDAGEVRYRYQDPIKRRERVLTADEVFVIRGRFGRSVLGYARESMSLQLAMQQWAMQSYKRGPRHTGVISRPQDAPKWSDKARSNFRKAIDEYMGEGERAGRPMLLEDGMTWESAGITMRDAEFLATLQHGVADICRWYRVPQHKVQELLRSTNNNISQQSTDYVVDSLFAWAVRWEQAIARDLIVAKAKFFAEHNLDALLRGDFQTRANAYALAIQWGWMTRAEVRQKENMNPIEGLDEPLTPMNMTTSPDGPEPAGGSSVTAPGGGRVPPGADQQPPSGAVVGYLRAMVRDGAARIVRKEQSEMARLVERTGGTGDAWERGVRAFFMPDHVDYVARVLHVPDWLSEQYTESRMSQFLTAGKDALGEYAGDASEALADLVIANHDVLRFRTAA